VVPLLCAAVGLAGFQLSYFAAVAAGGVAVSTAVASRVTEKNFGRAARYAARLEDAGHGDFAALLIRDAIRRKPALQQTPEFVKLMSSPLGQLMGGGN